MTAAEISGDSLEAEYDESTGDIAVLWPDGYWLTCLPSGKVVWGKSPLIDGVAPQSMDVRATAATADRAGYERGVREAAEIAKEFGGHRVRFRDDRVSSIFIEYVDATILALLEKRDGA